MNVILRIARTGLRRGLRDGSPRWLIVGITAGAVALIRRALTETPTTLYATELKPGERVEIRTVPRDS